MTSCLATPHRNGPVIRLSGVRQCYGRTMAVDDVSLEVPAGRLVGLIGPDGVGKSTLLGLVAGARVIQSGRIEVLGGEMADAGHRWRVCTRIAYMPQGLGKNLYPTLSVLENIHFFGRLFGHDREERHRRVASLLKATGLAPFATRAAGKLSGGMRQKLGLCCALIHDPDLLILDEPTTGVDPLSRRQFWELIGRIRDERQGMSVLVATAIMDEAARFDWLVAMDRGRVLATGAPEDLKRLTSTGSLEQAFVALLPEAERQEGFGVEIAPLPEGDGGPWAIEVRGLTMRFGDFVAVDRVNLKIRRGEIFGFLGSNGCGKTTTMKMLTGLLPASGGEARLLGHPVDAGDMETRRRVGYMSQGFSLYSELTVRQNLVLHGRLFQVPEKELDTRAKELTRRFGLADALEALPDSLPLGMRQRLSLAVALIHRPELLILDEPTSGVDPVARDVFWRILADLSRRERVTIFISTHFVNEAARCDRISLMHAGRVLVSDTPAAIAHSRGAISLEDAFIGYLEEASEKATDSGAKGGSTPSLALSTRSEFPRWFGIRRMWSYSVRETLELSRDPIRGTMAMVGSVILLVFMGYGISLDVENLRFAVLDGDQTTASRDYVTNIAGSRYFTERPPITSHGDLDRRMRAGELGVAIEIPPGFARDLGRGKPVEVGAWIDGAMPMRGETIRNYLRGMHAQWLADKLAHLQHERCPESPAKMEIRFRYNPDVKSIVSIGPAMIPVLLMMIPAMLAALSVVREKELGSIVNFHVTPVTRAEFLLGKQLPYLVLGFANYLILVIVAVFGFGIPFTGSLLAQAAGALVYIGCSTALGLLISSFMRSQVAAIFGTAVLTILPATQFSGMIDPVSSLEGLGALVGRVYPTAHFLTISRGTFSKALGLADLSVPFLALALALPILFGLGVAWLRKQET